MIGRGGDLGGLGRWPVWAAGLALVVALVGLNHAPRALRSLHREVTVYLAVYAWCRAEDPHAGTVIDWLRAHLACAAEAGQVTRQTTPETPTNERRTP